MATSHTVLSFGAWLRQARERRGLTALALAEKSGYSHVTIHNIEHEKKGVKRETVEALADALVTEGMLPEDRDRLKNDALLAAGFASGSPELEREPDEEYLQESIMAYNGPNPILSAAAATARSMKQLFDNAGQELTGEEPKEQLVRGRGPRKGITKVDGK